MTYISKKTLRARLNDAHLEADRLRAELATLQGNFWHAEGLLESLGFQSDTSTRQSTLTRGNVTQVVGFAKVRFTPPAGHSYVSAEALAQRDRDTESGTRRRTLEKVIDGLELTEYQEPWGGSIFGGLLAPEPKTGPADRLWSDIETAVEVRAAAKLEQSRRETADRVRAQLHPDYDDKVLALAKAGLAVKPAASAAEVDRLHAGLLSREPAE